MRVGYPIGRFGPVRRIALADVVMRIAGASLPTISKWGKLGIMRF
jgi:hypothetical protein